MIIILHIQSDTSFNLASSAGGSRKKRSEAEIGHVQTDEEENTLLESNQNQKGANDGGKVSLDRQGLAISTEGTFLNESEITIFN